MSLPLRVSVRCSQGGAGGTRGVDRGSGWGTRRPPTAAGDGHRRPGGRRLRPFLPPAPAGRLCGRRHGEGLPHAAGLVAEAVPARAGRRRQGRRGGGGGKKNASAGGGRRPRPSHPHPRPPPPVTSDSFPSAAAAPGCRGHWGQPSAATRQGTHPERSVEPSTTPSMHGAAVWRPRGPPPGLANNPAPPRCLPSQPPVPSRLAEKKEFAAPGHPTKGSLPTDRATGGRQPMRAPPRGAAQHGTPASGPSKKKTCLPSLLPPSPHSSPPATPPPHTQQTTSISNTTMAASTDATIPMGLKYFRASL